MPSEPDSLPDPSFVHAFQFDKYEAINHKFFRDENIDVHYLIHESKEALNFFNEYFLKESKIFNESFDVLRILKSQQKLEDLEWKIDNDYQETSQENLRIALDFGKDIADKFKDQLYNRIYISTRNNLKSVDSFFGDSDKKTRWYEIGSAFYHGHIFDNALQETLESKCYDIFCEVLNEAEQQLIYFSLCDPESISEQTNLSDRLCSSLREYIDLDQYFRNLARNLMREAENDYRKSHLHEDQDESLELVVNNFNFYINEPLGKLKSKSIAEFFPLSKKRNTQQQQEILELINEFVSVKTVDDFIIFLIDVINWDCQTPYIQSKPISVIDKNFTKDDLSNTLKNLMKNKIFFAKCTQCESIHNLGHINGDTCHKCMESEGVVF